MYEYDETDGDGRRHSLPPSGGGDVVTHIDGNRQREDAEWDISGGHFLDWLAAMPLYKSIRAVRNPKDLFYVSRRPACTCVTGCSDKTPDCANDHIYRWQELNFGRTPRSEME